MAGPDGVTQLPTNLHCCYLVSHGMKRNQLEVALSLLLSLSLSLSLTHTHTHTPQKVTGSESTHDGLTPGPSSDRCPTRFSSHYY